MDNEGGQLDTPNIITAKTLIKVMGRELQKNRIRPPFMMELRELRGNEDYKAIKPLIRKTIDHVQGLESAITSMKALVKVVVTELNTQPTLEDDEENDDEREL